METGSGNDEFDSLLGQLVQHRGGLQGRLEDLNQQIRDLQGSVARARKENERLNKRVGRRETSIQQMNERVGRRDEEIRGLKREKEGMKEALQSRDEEIRGLKRDKDQAGEELQAKDQSIDQLQDELDEIKALFRRPRTIAGPFEVLLEEGDLEYIDIFDGHRREGDAGARAWIHAYGIDDIGEDLCSHTWKYSSIANLQKEPGQPNEESKQDQKSQQEESSETTPKSPPRDSDPNPQIIPVGARRDTAFEADHRGTKRPLTRENTSDTDDSSRKPICHQCFRSNSVCSGAAHCAGCETKEDCRYMRCFNGLSCRRRRCGYVHPGQLRDEAEYTIRESDKRPSTRSEDSRLRGSTARDSQTRRRPVCMRCWQGDHWCQQGSKCGHCEAAGVKCVYKICGRGSACEARGCVYVHPGEDGPGWNVEMGSIGRRGGAVQPLQATREHAAATQGQVTERPRKAVCRNCWDRSSVCDWDEKCQNCTTLNVPCIRVRCADGASCNKARCPAAHPGQLGEGAIIYEGRL